MKKFFFTVPAKPIIVGKIISAYGVYGWVKILSFTESVKSIFDYQPWFINKDNKWHRIKLKSWKYHNQKLIAKVIGIDNREEAMLLANHKITISASQLSSLSNGEYYWKDFLGCQVFTVSGYKLGKSLI